MIRIIDGKFRKNLSLDIELPFKFLHRQLFMPFLMSYVSTLFSQCFLGSTLFKGVGRRKLLSQFWQNLNLDIKLPFKSVLRQLFMPFLMSYVSTLYSQYFLGLSLIHI